MSLAPGSRILFVTDTWHPQINGVVKAIEHIKAAFERTGIAVEIMHPEQFFSVPLPAYPEFRLALFSKRAIYRKIRDGAYDEVHIHTYGPVAWYARAACMRLGRRFTMTFHNQIHLYAEVRLGAWGRKITERLIKRLYAPAALTFVTTKTAEEQLRDFGLTAVAVWPLGVEEIFFTRKTCPLSLEKPVSVFLGRVAPEKNIEEFLKADIGGTKLVIGDGPDKIKLARAYPRVQFVGWQTGEALVAHLSCADVLVMPSRTETFGIVMLEALALGIPVAAHDVMGPRDVIVNGVNGYLDEDLTTAVEHCLSLSSEACRESARNYSWAASAERFIALVNDPRYV